MELQQKSIGIKFSDHGSKCIRKMVSSNGDLDEQPTPDFGCEKGQQGRGFRNY